MLLEVLLNTELTRFPNELIAAIEANETIIRRRAYSARSWPFSSCHSLIKSFFIEFLPSRARTIVLGNYAFESSPRRR
jgi:hypothetical protein